MAAAQSVQSMKSSKKAQTFILFATSSFLACALLFQLTSRRRTTDRVDIPFDLPVPMGWSVRDEPLGPTEALTAESLKVLRMDKFIHKSYSRGDVKAALYIAYWRELNEAAPIVLAHLPDRCWVSSGMTCVEMKNRVTIGRDGGLPMAEWRLFMAPNGQPTHVLYWLWVGGEPFKFGLGLTGRYDFREGFYHANIWTQARWWMDHAKKGSREQVFIRWSANIPMLDLMSDPEIDRLLRAVILFGAGTARNETTIAAGAIER
jgi:hypothetical protein